MEIIINHGDNFEIKLIGRLDTVTSLELSERLQKEEIKEDLVVVNAEELEYISSAGLRVLLSLKKSLAPQGKALEIHKLNPVCTEVFKVTGFNNIITIK